ncbi:MAG: hypothetical protein ABI632_12815 [Pseudolysinimonas sp.]
MLNIRKSSEEVLYAIVAQLNAFRRDATIVGARFHSSALMSRSGPFFKPVAATETIAAANASDLATSLVLVNAIHAFLVRHVAEGTHVHKTADATAVAALAAGVTATDLATAQTLANVDKAAYNAHLAQANVHYNNDGTNNVTSANATDQSSLNTLVNEMKGDINAHVASFPAGFNINLVGA